VLGSWLGGNASYGNGIFDVVIIDLVIFWVVCLLVLAWAITTAAPHDRDDAAWGVRVDENGAR